MKKQKPRIPKQLSRESAAAFLHSARFRPCKSGHQWEVEFMGLWWELCRTDLENDVCTSGPGYVEGKADDPRLWALQANRYGVRFAGFDDDPYPARLCAVIDRRRAI